MGRGFVGSVCRYVADWDSGFGRERPSDLMEVVLLGGRHVYEVNTSIRLGGEGGGGGGRR